MSCPKRPNAGDTSILLIDSENITRYFDIRYDLIMGRCGTSYDLAEEFEKLTIFDMQKLRRC